MSGPTVGLSVESGFDPKRKLMSPLWEVLLLLWNTQFFEHGHHMRQVYWVAKGLLLCPPANCKRRLGIDGLTKQCFGLLPLAVVIECCGQQHWLDGLWVAVLPFAKRDDGSFQVASHKAGAAEHHAIEVRIEWTEPHGTLDMANGIGWSATVA